MIKFTMCLRRLPRLSESEFHAYWRDIHGPLALSLQPCLGFKKYVQVHAISTPLNHDIRGSRSSPEPFDGIAEGWWESLDVLARYMQDPAAQEAWRKLVEDEHRFIDVRNSPVWLSEELVMVG